MIRINETGARTITEARPMTIGGRYVYVTFSKVAAGHFAELHIEGRIVAEREITEEMTVTEAQAWAVEYRDAMNEQIAAELAEFIAHVDAAETETVSPAVAQVREQGAELLAKAEAAEVHGNAPFRTPRLRNGQQRGWVTLRDNDPRHPANVAKSLRRSAEILTAWTQADEDGYRQYVSGGIGDTDGWFAPESRQAWKAFQG